MSSNSKQDWHDLVLDQRKAEKPNGEVTRAICHFRNERESGTSCLSQRPLGLSLGTGKKIDQWLTGDRRMLSNNPETITGRISAPVPISFLKWPIRNKAFLVRRKFREGLKI